MRETMALATGVRSYIAASVGLRLAATLTVVAQGVIVAAALERVLDGEGVGDQAGVLTAAAGLVVVRAALAYAAAAVASATAAATKERLRDRAFAKLAELGPGHTSGTSTSDATAAVVDGVEALESYYASYLPSLAGVVATPVVVVAVLATRDPWLAALLAVVVAASAVVPFGWLHMLRERNGARMRAYLGLAATFLDTLQGLETLKAFGASGRRRAELAATCDRLIARWNSEMSVALLSHLFYAVGVTGGLALIVAVAAVRTADGGLAVGTLFVTLLLAAEALRAVGTLANAFHASYDAATATERLGALFAATPLAPERAGATVTPPAAPVGAGQRRRPGLAFEGVTFTYPGAAAPVLHDVTLRVEPGGTVAVVGPSGAGKSTLAALLLRFADPQHGVVRIDGVDVRDLPLDRVRSAVSLVAQDTYLFGGTVRDNIAMARPGASDDEVEAAARAANAEAFVRALPDGYATEVGERGLRLSGGQRQRIAIARAVLADRPILVLDEATASVDTATEASIQSALDRLAVDRTTLVIAHRLSTVRDADRVVVLDGGRIAEVGRHDDLIEHRGPYARLVAAQEVR